MAAEQPRRPHSRAFCSTAAETPSTGQPASPTTLPTCGSRLQERLPLSAYRRPLVGTGFCGAFTTFSTMQLELVEMLDAHRYGLAVAYATSSVGERHRTENQFVADALLDLQTRRG
jgi:CrcB-like protein, Camphor Resistance (CrcB)